MADDQADRMETLLIGIDAAAPDILSELFEPGAIPHLRSIFEDGVGGPLPSQIPPWTASAWPSIYTGVNPGKHGVYDFLTFDGYDWDVVNRSFVREYALWELLDHHGLSSVVVNVPVTHPPRAFDGALVPGYASPEDPKCHPEGLLSELRSELGSYDVYRPSSPASDDERIQGYRELVRMRGEAFRYLADRFDPDFGFVQFQQTDTVFHEIPEHRTAAREVYAAVDDEIGQILERCDPETVFVVSDHGIGAYDGVEVRVNEYLRDNGYIETVNGGDGMPSWTAVESEEPRSDNGTGERARPLVRMASAAAKVGLTSQRIESILDRLGLAEAVARRVPTDVIRAGTERVDFGASTAYMRSRVELGVRLNRQGRDPDGVVPPEEYDTVRAEVIEVLADARTPDGEPAFERILPREEVFHGPYLEEAPDVITVPAGYDHLVSASLLGDAFAPLPEPWGHKPVGVFAASGAAVDAEPGIDGASLFDVAPTVLASLGVPTSDRMDGDPLPIVEPVGTGSYPEFESSSRVATDDAGVERRLADLGYLE